MKRHQQVFYFWIVVYQTTQSNFKHHRQFAQFKFQNHITLTNRSFSLNFRNVLPW